MPKGPHCRYDAPMPGTTWIAQKAKVMKNLQVLPIFPQLVTCRPAVDARRFHGVALPDDGLSLDTFYRGLPCVGLAAREICRSIPSANLNTVLCLSLNALRQQVVAHRRGMAADGETKTLEKIREVLTEAYAEVKRKDASLDEIAALTTAQTSSNDKQARPSIMVVDPCPMTRFLIGTELRRAGFDVRTVEDATEALLLSAVTRPDLILMEARMDELSGVLACEILCDSRLSGRPPVILMCEEGDKVAIAAGIESGAADILPKPFDATQALPSIATQIEIRRLQRENERDQSKSYGANHLFGCLQSLVSHNLLKQIESAGKMAAALDIKKFHAATETLNVSPGSLGGKFIAVNTTTNTTTLDSETFELDLKRMDLASLMRLVVWIFSTEALRKQIQLRIDVPETALFLEGDEVRIQRVLENLLSNAIKFSPPRSTVVLGARLSNGEVHVWVDDAGPGVPETEQPGLFTEHTRISSQATGADRGTGLGLVVCERIVSAHAGGIAMRNLEEGGARFEFVLPQTAQAEPSSRLLAFAGAA